MSIVQYFSNSEIRFVDHPEGKYEFGIVATDMATILNLDPKQTNKMPVDDEWKGQTNVTTPGGVQSMTVIWEPGIYQALAKSRKPQAKPFQKWVFEEVLPSIRKTGKYEPNNAPVEVTRVIPQRDAVDFIQAAKDCQSLPNGLLKQLLNDMLIDQVSLEQNLKYLLQLLIVHAHI